MWSDQSFSWSFIIKGDSNDKRLQSSSSIRIHIINLFFIQGVYHILFCVSISSFCRYLSVFVRFLSDDSGDEISFNYDQWTYNEVTVFYLPSYLRLYLHLLLQVLLCKISVFRVDVVTACQLRTEASYRMQVAATASVPGATGWKRPSRTTRPGRRDVRTALIWSVS